MYCPKCKQTFEDGSRRFCPSDGARLISDSGDPKAGSVGVFASLLPNIGSVSEFDETLSDVPRFVMSEPAPEFDPIQKAGKADVEEDEIFFELDEIEIDTLPDIGNQGPPSEPSVERPIDPPPPVPRKIDPSQIPAGHVDLLESDRSAPYQLDFDEEEPERFVGRIVKGRYKVTEYLGGDESGLAYLADDKILDDKKVLVRILLAEPADEILRSILAEERVSLAHFSHPNVARLVDSGSFSDGTEFLVSEFFDALSVSEILSIHGRFSPARAGRIIKQVANALSEAHQEGILHRDIRPENIILDSSTGEAEQVKLVNFGASNGEPNSQNASYKSPEVLEGRIATIASDVFSLAVVSYEMLTGEIPFRGETAKEILRSQNSASASLPTDLRSELPLAVDDVLTKAMSYDRADRYPKARDFGDALFEVLTSEPKIPMANVSGVNVADTTAPVEHQVGVRAKPESEKVVVLRPLPADTALPNKVVSEPAWKNRSPEPPAEENSRFKWIAAAGIAALLVILAVGWYFMVNRPEPIDVPAQVDHITNQANTSPIAATTEMPPLPRTIPQPPDTNFFQNSKQNLKGDLLRNFVGFTLYYPKSWKINGPQNGATPNARGKFIDISSSTPDDRMKEQMLVSYYPSKGTFREDADKFPQMVGESNDTLKKILPGYQVVSQGEIKLNGDWRAYEIKFQAEGKSSTGEKIVVWGRRLFLPAARPGARNGFEITMLATSYSEDVKGVDDVGVKGGLATVLYSFEPSQNF